MSITTITENHTLTLGEFRGGEAEVPAYDTAPTITTPTATEILSTIDPPEVGGEAEFFVSANQDATNTVGPVQLLGGEGVTVPEGGAVADGERTFRFVVVALDPAEVKVI